MKLYHPTNDIGYDSNPFYKSNCAVYPRGEDGCPHMGHDIFSNRGTEILAVLDGIVLQAGQAPDTCGYGNRIVIEHDAPGQGFFRKLFNGVFGVENKKIKSLYAHLDNCLVKDGDIVKAGDVIGGMGDTGYGSVHLHFGVGLPEQPADRKWVHTQNCGIANGYYVDPLVFLLEFYGDQPQYTGIVIERQGMNVRECPSTSCTIVDELVHEETVVIMETVKAEGYVWGLLKSFEGLPPEWVACSRGAYIYIELTPVDVPPVEPPIEPPTEPPTDCSEAVKEAFELGKQEGWQEAITTAQTAWDEMRSDKS